MKRYTGERRKDGSVRVLVWDDVSYGMKLARWTKLDPRPDLVEGPQHLQQSSAPLAAASPGPAPAAVGFDWGVSSPASAHLAAAILADCVGEGVARACYREFARSVVLDLAPGRWSLDERRVWAAAGELLGVRDYRSLGKAPPPTPPKRVPPPQLLGDAGNYPGQSAAVRRDLQDLPAGAPPGGPEGASPRDCA